MKGTKRMCEVGIYICNYNKREFVIKCVESLLAQTMKEIDITVVDNASQDDSVSVLQAVYGDKIFIIESEENLGGSGGFNIGLRDALQKKYKYVVSVLKLRRIFINSCFLSVQSLSNVELNESARVSDIKHLINRL